MATRRKKMLVLRFSALGDVAMTIPVIYSLARRYPDLDVTVVTRPFFARLFIGAPSNVNVMAVDLKKEYRGPWGLIKLLHKLKTLHPDYVADLHNVLRTWIIDRYFKILGAKVEMVDKNRRDRHKLFESGEHQRDYIDRYADVFTRLGYPVQPTFRSLFERDGMPSVPLEIHHPAIGIAPFARYTNKTYPPRQMLRVVKHLTSIGYNVYLFGATGNESEQLSAWAGQTDRCTSVAGAYPIAEELAIMAAMDLMVAMDSSNHHLASLAGTKVLSIWGGTTPACGFMAYGQAPDRALHLSLTCQPCSVAGSDSCRLGDFRCLCTLSPETVIERITSIVAPGL